MLNGLRRIIEQAYVFLQVCARAGVSAGRLPFGVRCIRASNRVSGGRVCGAVLSGFLSAVASAEEEPAGYDPDLASG